MVATLMQSHRGSMKAVCVDETGAVGKLYGARSFPMMWYALTSMWGFLARRTAAPLGGTAALLGEGAMSRVLYACFFLGWADLSYYGSSEPRCSEGFSIIECMIGQLCLTLFSPPLST